MKNNYWEEQNMSVDIKEFHSESLRKMDVPDWMNIDCPYCHKSLPLNSIRSTGIKLNARNKGDIFIEFFCDDCKLMNTVYYRRQLGTVSEFTDFLKGSKIPDCKPVLEEDMYKLRYNNVMEEFMLSKIKGGL